jgi:hypothetical protein
MQKRGEKISLAVITIIYLLCSLRYFPKQPATTLLNTVTHLLTVGPFLVGAVLLYNSLYQQQTGARPAPAKMLRLGLTMGIIIEFFVGLFNYLEGNRIG